MAAALGMEIPSSTSYMLNWKGSPEHLKSSLGEIQRPTKMCLAIVTPKETLRIAA